MNRGENRAGHLGRAVGEVALSAEVFSLSLVDVNDLHGWTDPASPSVPISESKSKKL